MGLGVASAGKNPTKIAVYDVDADAFATMDVNLQKDGECTLTQWVEGAALEYWCATRGELVTTPVRNVPEWVATPSAESPSGDDVAADGVRRTGIVGFGEAPSRGTLFP